MIKVGIDTLAIYTPRYALDLATLAKARNVEADKYHAGLGQYTMSVAPPGEDIVTMAANAAKEALQGIDLNSIEMLLFATESGTDQSKAAGMYVHQLLDLPLRCRVLELKQACYAGTGGLQLALPYLRENPDKKVLLIASDIARYGLESVGESSQGAASIAMVLSANPRILALESEFGIAAENVMDFWRPNYLHEALVEGKYSSKIYLTMLEKTWQQYSELSGRKFQDHAYFCYHVPVPRLVEKAHQSLLKINGLRDLPDEVADQQIHASLQYGRKIGNSYTAALYVALASLLDNAEENLAGKRIGFYSYGSGCVAEYFSGVVQANYQDALHTTYHQDLLASRTLLSYDEYVAFFSYHYNEMGEAQEIPYYQTGGFHLARLQQHKRVYEKINNVSSHFVATSRKENVDDNHEEAVLRVYAPGKLILSGEHSVLYGQPAIAMAVNRYATATITRERQPQFSFDLSDLAHRSHLSFSALRDMKDRVKRKYHKFIRGEYTIRDVLQKPFELAQVAMGIVAENLKLPLPHGVKVQVQSDIPIGCGMGSSAATIISVMHAVANYLQLPLPEEALFKLALEAENLQHGQSSGLDLRVAMQGGCIYVHGQKIETRPLPSLPMYLVNTGTPNSTTGQCVESAARYFAGSQLGDEFGAVTNAMDAALQQQSWPEMREAIRANHRLLVDIGVVPEKVQRFIATIETEGGAAKICGAGSITGDAAGAVLVATDNDVVLTRLSQEYGYHILPIVGSARGVHAA